MEEKKQIKVSLGAVISVFIIILLSVALVGMYYYYNFVVIPKYEVANKETENITENEQGNVNNENDTDMEEVTPKDQFDLALMSIEGKECLNYESREGVTRKYTIRDIHSEKNGIEIEEFDDKLYLMVNSSRLNNVCGQIINIQSDKRFEITNIDTSNVKNIYISDYEQDSSWNYAFFLMNDGTVEWLDLEEALKNKNFVAEGKIESVTKVEKIAKLEFIYDSEHPNARIESTIIAIKEDGRYYDLIGMFMDGPNHGDLGECDYLNIVNSKNEEYGIEISNSNQRVYLTIVSDEYKFMFNNGNFEQNKEYEITNIDASNIKSIYVSDHGTSGNYPIALFLMKDGTVEWLQIGSGDLVAEGKIENVENIVRIETVNVGEHYELSDDGAGWISVIGIREDGNFYDLVDATLNAKD